MVEKRTDELAENIPAIGKKSKKNKVDEIKVIQAIAEQTEEEKRKEIETSISQSHTSYQKGKGTRNC